MGVQIDADSVRKIALDMMRDLSPWEYCDTDQISYLKLAMYNAGIFDLADEIIKAIEK